MGRLKLPFPVLNPAEEPPTLKPPGGPSVLEVGGGRLPGIPGGGKEAREAMGAPGGGQETWEDKLFEPPSLCSPIQLWLMLV